MVAKQRISILADNLAICRLDPEDDIPHWALKHRFVCITRTLEELSIVAPAALIPDHLPNDKGWRCVKIEGPLDLTLSGLLVSVIEPLSKAGISVLAIATYDTDYFLVKETQIELAVQIMIDQGHDVFYA